MMLRGSASGHQAVAAGCVLVLVVAAVFLFPVFACACSTVEGSRKTACISNLKHLALAHGMYAADHEDRMPPAEAWMDVTRPFVKKVSSSSEIDFLYRCPVVVKTNRQAHGYAFRLKLAGHRIDTIKRPEGAVILFDSTRLERNVADDLQSLPRPGRHTGEKNVFAYVDGHAKAR